MKEFDGILMVLSSVSKPDDGPVRLLVYSSHQFDLGTAFASCFDIASLVDADAVDPPPQVLADQYWIIAYFLQGGIEALQYWEGMSIEGYIFWMIDLLTQT